MPLKWLSTFTLNGIINLVGLNFFFFLLCWSYGKTMISSPGFVDRTSVPAGYTPEELEQLKELDIQLKKENYLKEEHFFIPRWCKFCQHWKPPRSHHCREFNRCVLKLDHYCPWVYNAVGYRNHKFFILFLLYASLCLTYFLICCIIRVFYEISYRQRGRPIFTIPEIILLIMQLVLTLPVTIGIISLLVYQISCLIANCTNIETFALKRYKRGAKIFGNNSFKWFYDHGIIQNIKQVMGLTILEWFWPELPLHVKTGTGIDWQLRADINVPSREITSEEMLNLLIKKDQ